MYQNIILSGLYAPSSKTPTCVAQMKRSYTSWTGLENNETQARGGTFGALFFYDYSIIVMHTIICISVLLLYIIINIIIIII